ncbi:hypothetical protein POM88_006115 [Heracleum sosnowskyi]|uniref:Uncharacterized protein n=1 Tax=Heracleum sosnowskyi TaxID=360622 RepID=A0AAD8J5D4_9APIA|nr:hypothetical protein POM88_006115 [Heracleum sosnowskyi]
MLHCSRNRYLGIMSKQISKSVVGGSSPAWLEQPTATKSEFASMSQNQSGSQFTPHGVYPTPSSSLLQSPAQQVSYAPRPMSAAGGSYMSSQMPQPMVQTTSPSPTMPAGYSKRKAASGSENQRGCVTNKISDQFMPYPPKEDEDADSTLSDVIDYIMLTKGEIQRLEEELSLLQSLQQLN